MKNPGDTETFLLLAERDTEANPQMATTSYRLHPSFNSEPSTSGLTHLGFHSDPQPCKYICAKAHATSTSCKNCLRQETYWFHLLIHQVKGA